MKPSLGLALGTWLAAATALHAAESQPEYASNVEAEAREEAPAFDEATALRQLDADVQASQHKDLQSAMALFRSGQWAGVIARLEPLIDQDPTVLAAWNLLGQAYLRSQRAAEALKLWERLRAIRPDFVPVYNWIGRARMQRNETQAAIAAYRASLQRNPAQDREPTKLNLARLLRWSGDQEGAIALLRPLHQAFPDDPQITRELASALLSNRDFALALPLWSALRAREPESTPVLAKEAVALFHTGQAEEALVQARRVLAADSANADALGLLADNAQYRSDTPEDALPLLLSLAELTPAPKRHRQLVLRYVNLYYRLHEREPERFPLQHPITQLANLVEQDPYDADLRLALAETQMAQRDYAPAREQLGWVLENLNPNNRRALLNLFEIALAENRSAEALRFYQRYEAFNPRDPYRHYYLARWYAQQSRYPSAYRELEALEAAGRRGAVAVLLYHGLSSSTNNEVLPAARLREHLTALKQAGFRFIAANALTNYFENQAEAGAEDTAGLERVACITFDDARRDSMRYGTPIARELRIPFSMHIPVSYLDNHHPFICTWDMLRDYQKEGGWVFGGHTVDAHERAPVDAASRPGFPLPNRLWLAGEKRLENDAEYEARLTREYEACHEAIVRQLGPAGGCNFFAYPFGDIGQCTRSNDRDAPARNLAHAARSYAVGFVQTSFGYAVADDQPLLYQRYEPARTDTADDVLTHVLVNHPAHLARRLRAEFAAQDNKRHLMLAALRALQRDGYPAAALLQLHARLEKLLGRRFAMPAAEAVSPETYTYPPRAAAPQAPDAIPAPAAPPTPERAAETQRRDAPEPRERRRDLHDPLR